MQALRPEPLEHAHLPNAVRDLAKRWAETSGVAVRTDTTSDPRPLLPDCEVALFRVAQEALANVAKHASASTVVLTLSYMDDVVVRRARRRGRLLAGGPPQRVRAGGHGAAGVGHARGGERAGRGHRIVGEGAGHPRGGDGVIRVLIVDDHPVVRDGLRGVLAGEPDMEVVGEAGHGAEALARVAAQPVDVVLMDLRMPTMGEVEAIGAMRRVAPAVRVLVLTTFDTDRDVLPAIEAGAIGYLLKDTPREELLRAVRAAYRGEAVLSPAVAGRLMGQVRAPAAEALSARELEVLRLVAAGATNREAARRLFLSEATIKTHLLHIYAKLGVRDRASAVAAGYQRGLRVPD